MKFCAKAAFLREMSECAEGPRIRGLGDDDVFSGPDAFLRRLLPLKSFAGLEGLIEDEQAAEMRSPGLMTSVGEGETPRW